MALPRSTPAADGPPRILVVDDSVVARTVIARGIAATGIWEVAGQVTDVAAARAFLASNSVDAIVLDINLPGVDGLTALPDLIAASGGARVLIVSSACGEGAAATVQALALGAADTLVKPAAGALAGRFADALTDRLQKLLQPASELPAADRVAHGTVAASAFDVVAIGASTGGIHALSALLRELPPAMMTPILVTQHLPASFMPYFAAQLAVLAGRPCEVATDSMRIRPGRVIVAPGDAHMRVVRAGELTAIRLNRRRSVSGCLPSVDPMLESVAAVYGTRALAVVLSGMGRDGTLGAQMVARAGGQVVVQDEASSVVWGMPGAVAGTGCADAVLPPAAIGRLIAGKGGMA